MTRMMHPLVLLALAFASACALAAPAHAADYVQTRGSTLEFTGRYDHEAFTGHFPGFRTTLRFDPDRLAQSTLDVEIPLAMSTTHRSDYDSEMRAVWFLDVAEFPKAHYTASKFRRVGKDQFVADGALTLRGVTRPVALTFTWTPGERPVLAGTAKVNRLAFGVGTQSDWGSSITTEIGIATRVVFVAK